MRQKYNCFETSFERLSDRVLLIQTAEAAFDPKYLCFSLIAKIYTYFSNFPSWILMFFSINSLVKPFTGVQVAGHYTDYSLSRGVGSLEKLEATEKKHLALINQPPSLVRHFAFLFSPLKDKYIHCFIFSYVPYGLAPFQCITQYVESSGLFFF